MFCQNCGTRLEDGTVFCPECGAKITPSTQRPQPERPPYYPGPESRGPMPAMRPGASFNGEGAPDEYDAEERSGNTGILIACIIGGAVILIAIIVLVVVLLFKKDIIHNPFSGKNVTEEEEEIENDDLDNDDEDSPTEVVWDEEEESDFEEEESTEEDEDEDEDEDDQWEDVDEDEDSDIEEPLFDEDIEDGPEDTETPPDEDEDYILPDSDTKRYDEASLRRLSKEELRLARNEIYARHGRRFKSRDLQDYFNGKDWYRPERDEIPDTELNEIEIANRDLIVKTEESR